MTGAHGYQKRVSGPLDLSDRWVRVSRCGCWGALSPLQDFLFGFVLWRGGCFSFVCLFVETRTV